MPSYLTTAKYLNGIHCLKRLWYEEKHPEKAPPFSLFQQRLFEQRKALKTLVYSGFPEGVYIDAEEPDVAVWQTETAISRGESCIFNAAFHSNGAFVQSDILQKNEKGWHIIEFRASKKIKKEYLLNLALQKHILDASDVPISATQLLLLNEACVYPDLSNLFVFEDVTDKVNVLEQEVPDALRTFNTIRHSDVEPSVLIGKNLCNRPYRCPFKTPCWAFMPKNSVFTIPKIKDPEATLLAESGIFRLSDLPTDFPLTPAQSNYVDSVLENRPVINRAAIRRALANLQYPIHFLDFEADRPVVPRFNGFKVYEEFPFQFSCHILQSDGVVTHHEYLHPDTTDPRPPLLHSLLAHISDQGSIVVYNLSTERRILRGLAESFPEYASALRSIIKRLWDQLTVLRKHYEHPDFCGSKSLKTVLPVLVPSLSYKTLDIQEGGDAPAVWNLMLSASSETEKQEWDRRLRTYCKLDTLAMVEIHKVLQEKSTYPA
ncbi:DUF2779 domain-containing protein [Candidatus Poribacteria bacterium]|nr:DUF2779 domain-containing protein [Candidatus Poribacteria bacterium]